MVDMPQPGWLLLTDSWYPGWSAIIDGKVSQVHQADHFFKAVRVPSGTHEVIFQFDPPLFHAGVAISIGASLLWLGAILFSTSRFRAMISSVIAKNMLKRPQRPRAT